MGKSSAKSGPKSTQRTTSITPASIASTLSSFSPATTSKSSFYAHLHRAPDAHTLRVYEVATGKCVSRWASNAVGDEEEQRVESLEWALIPQPVAGEGTAAEAEAEGKRGKKRRKSDSALELPTAAAATTAPEDKLVLALGLTNGSILLWTPNGSNPVTLSHATSLSPVTALSSPLVDSSSASSGHLWSAHADGAVRVWDLATGAIVGKASGLPEGTHWDSLAVRYLAAVEGAKRATAHLLLSHLSLHLYSVALPAAGKKDKLRDLKTVNLGRCTGHIEACSVLFPPSSSFSSSDTSTTFLSYAPSDRFVQIWSLPLLPSPSPANGTLLARLALPSGVSFVALHPSPLDPTDESVLAAIDTEGQVSLARLPVEFPTASASPKEGKTGIVALEVESEVVGRAGEAAGVVKVLFGEEGQMVLVRGGVKPVFESVAFADANGAWIARVELERAVNGLLNGSEDVAGASLPTRYAETAASTVRTGDAVPTADSDDEDSALANSGALDVDMAEPTLADRLKAMNVTKAAQAADSDDGTEGSDEGSDEEDEAITTVPATTLTTTLIQALHSSDAPLLESCLSHTSPSLIRATVKRLPSGSLVLGLLEVLVERLGKGKKGAEGSASVKRARGLIEWVRQVLIVHVGFLVTIPSLVNRLATLHASLSSRLALQPTLLALNGRLELVMSQIDLRQERVAARASIAAPAKKQGKTYVEGESSSEEEEEGMSEDEGSVEDVVLGSDEEEESGEEDDEDEDEDDEDEDDFEVRPRRKGGKMNVSELLDLEASEEDEDDEEDSEEEGDSEDSDED